MKKMNFFQLSLFLLLLGMTSVNAQVHIGSDANPHLGAVLDLTNPNEQGLLLPSVKLTDVDVWQPVPGEAADGMVVFTDGLGGLTSGIYVWNNGKWGLLTGSDIPGTGSVTGVTLNPATWNFTTAAPKTLTCAVLPANAANKNVTWSSSDESVATVLNGVITPMGNGSATITVTTEEGGKTASCAVTVNLPYPVTGVSLSPTSWTFTTTDTKTLIPAVSPVNATNQNVIWGSSNTGVATVLDGVVSPVANGTAIITVTTADGAKTATCDITVDLPVPDVSVTGVSLNTDIMTFTASTPQTLIPIVSPGNATDKAVIWSSNNPGVAAVTNGVVTPAANGNAVITVITIDGAKKATCDVTVAFAVTGVSLDKPSLSFINMAAKTLIPTVAPTNAANQNVTWSSSDETVATVVDGVITPVGNGAAIITVTTVDGNKKATCVVDVAFAITSITLSPASLNFTTTDAQTLTPTINPSNAANQTLTWSSSNESVATVVNGVVTPVGGGTATITATATDGSDKSAACSVTAPYFIQNGAYFAPSGYQSFPFESTTINMAKLTGTYGFSVSGDLLLYGQDLPDANWTDAQTACAALGDSWRLPNIAELGNLQDNYASYGLSLFVYWSITERNGTTAWYWNLDYVHATPLTKSQPIKVRCVKSL